MCVIKHELKIPPPYAMVPPHLPHPYCNVHAKEGTRELALRPRAGRATWNVEAAWGRGGVVRLASVSRGGRVELSWAGMEVARDPHRNNQQQS